MRKYRSEVVSQGDLKMRLTLTRWRLKFVALELWTPMSVGCGETKNYHYTVIKGVK